MSTIRNESGVKRITLSAGQLQKRKPVKLLPRQNFIAWAYVTKEKNAAGKTGIYMMGTFAHLEEAQLYVKEIHDRGFDRFDILISDTYEWVPFPPPVNHSNPDLRTEHVQPMMREIMGGHKKMNNDAADLMEERQRDVKELQVEAKARAKQQRYFNRCIAQVLECVPIVPTTVSGVGTGAPMKDLLRRQAEAELERLKAEAEEEFNQEMKRLKGLEASSFGPSLKRLFARRSGDTRFELEDLERKEAGMQRDEEMEKRKKQHAADVQAAEQEREAKKSVMIQALKEQVHHAKNNTSHAVVAPKATPKPAIEMTLDEVVSDSVPVANPSLTGKQNRNRRRRHRQQAAKRAARAQKLEEAALMDQLDDKTKYAVLVERLKAEVELYDPASGKAMTEEQEKLERELRMQTLLEQLDRQRMAAHRQIKEEGGAAEEEKEFTQEEQQEMLRLALQHAQAERTNTTVDDATKARMDVLKERRDKIEARKARVNKRKAAGGGDSVLKDMGVTIGRSQTRRPKGLQE